MTKKFSESFKLQAVEKLLNKDEQSTILDISNNLVERLIIIKVAESE